MGTVFARSVSSLFADKEAHGGYKLVKNLPASDFGRFHGGGGDRLD